MQIKSNGIEYDTIECNKYNYVLIQNIPSLRGIETGGGRCPAELPGRSLDLGGGAGLPLGGFHDEAELVSEIVGVPGLSIPILDTDTGEDGVPGRCVERFEEEECPAGDAVRMGRGGTGGGALGDLGRNDLDGIGVPGACAGERARTGVEDGV